MTKTIYRLKSCVWEITLACCFSCRYCGSKAGKARENELTTAECLDVAKQLADLGCKRVSMIGGEVFMRSDWSEIVKSLTDRGVAVSVITNGYRLSENDINKLLQVKIESVAVSIDGPEAIHDFFRQPGSFQRALDAVDQLVYHNIPVAVITTLNSKNVQFLNELWDVLKEKNLFAWQLQACSPMGNASHADFQTQIDFGQVIHFVEEHLKTASFAVGVADNIGYYTESEGALRGSPGGKGCFRGCRAGLTSAGIDSIGNVRGCESMYDDSFIEGNLREKPLAEIWNNPDAFAYNRRFTTDLLTGKCRKCDKKESCAGGCRSYNYFTHGKLYESMYCAR